MPEAAQRPESAPDDDADPGPRDDPEEPPAGLVAAYLAVFTIALGAGTAVAGLTVGPGYLFALGLLLTVASLIHAGLLVQFPEGWSE